MNVRDARILLSYLLPESTLVATLALKAVAASRP